MIFVETIIIVACQCRHLMPNLRINSKYMKVELFFIFIFEAMGAEGPIAGTGCVIHFLINRNILSFAFTLTFYTARRELNMFDVRYR